jgi:hypothetical protein
MDPAPSPGAGSESPAASGRASVDHETVKKPDDRMSKVLEWTRAIGMPLVTLAVTIVGGYFFTTLSNEREARESNDRLYAQLLTQREQSDALIRKDMFGVVIKSFLADVKPEDWSTKVLQLELLANNFNQSLDLAPLFKDLARRLAQGTNVPSAQSAALKRRLDRTAANLIFRQVNSLARRGFVKEQQLPLADWQKSFGKPFIDEPVPKTKLMPSTSDSTVGGKDPIYFNVSVELVDVAVERREVEVRLRVNFPDPNDQDVDRHFWVGQYDFPMLDNTQLPYGLRVSVVITEFFVPDAPEEREANSLVQFHLVVFPSASASFKERQDYDDILQDMLRTKGNERRAKGRLPGRESEPR